MWDRRFRLSMQFFGSTKTRPARIEIKPGRYWSKKQRMFKGFQKPKRLVANTETLTERYGQFTAQPFQRGFGTTIGNSLRRVLLSSIEGAAITAIRIEGVDHEFSPIPGVVEDATDIIPVSYTHLTLPTNREV